MSFTVPVTLFGWLGVALLLFAYLPPRRAMLAGLIGAWLFLPMAGYLFPLLQYDKIAAVGLGLLLGVCMFDSRRLLAFRPRRFDLPALVLCLSPAISTFGNGQEVANAGASTTGHLLQYGVPYVMGRIYFRTLDDLRELAWAMFIGGLVYVPLCLYEIRMSPQLHTMVYGFYQHQFAQAIRSGSWRPTVFMQHGLAVAFWMCAASMVGIGLWLSGEGKRRRWLGAVLIVMLATLALCKCTGTLFLLVLGTACVFLARAGFLRWGMAILILYVPAYMTSRGIGLVNADDFTNAMARIVSDPDRIDSLRARLEQEDILCKRALQHPAIGWGPWGEFQVNEHGERLVNATDGLWVILFGKFGLIGLGSFTLLLLLPAGLMVWRLPGRTFGSRQLLPIVALSLVLLLYAIDSLMNAMPNPVFIVIAGAVSSVAGAGSLALNPLRKPRIRAIASRSEVTGVAPLFVPAVPRF